jgi:hypothetical protein
LVENASYEASSNIAGIEVNCGRLLLSDALTRIHDNQFHSCLSRLSAIYADEVTAISCAGWRIESIDGIEIFTELTDLNLWQNQLDNIDLSFNTKLTALNLAENNLTNLNLSNNTELTGVNIQDMN